MTSFGRAMSIALFAALPVPLAAFDLPSGLEVSLTEVLVDQVGGETWLRFRFIVPAIARGEGAVTYADAEGDMAQLCSDLALPYLSEHQLKAEIVVISFSDRPVEFGVADPEATQFFDAFRVSDGTCVWEAF